MNRERNRKKRQNRTHRYHEHISLAATVSRDVIALTTSLHGIGPLIQDGTLRKKVAETEKPWHCPKKFELESIRMPDFTMELLTPRTLIDPFGEGREVILQLHGGGYMGAVRNAYYVFAGLYNEVSHGCNVLTPDYRVAPEHPYPAALEDAVASYQWLLDKGYYGEQIIVAGDSAGGGLAMALCMYLKAYADAGRCGWDVALDGSDRKRRVV